MDAYFSLVGKLTLSSAILYNRASKVQSGDFPGGPLVKNPTANAGDMGSTPGPEVSYATRQLSLCVTVTEAHVP